MGTLWKLHFYTCLPVCSAVIFPSQHLHWSPSLILGTLLWLNISMWTEARTRIWQTCTWAPAEHVLWCLDWKAPAPMCKSSPFPFQTILMTELGGYEEIPSVIKNKETILVMITKIIPTIHDEWNLASCTGNQNKNWGWPCISDGTKALIWKKKLSASQWHVYWSFLIVNFT